MNKFLRNFAVFIGIFSGCLLVGYGARAATVTGLSTSVISPGNTQLIITGGGFGASASYGDYICFNEIIISTFELPCVYSTSSEMISWTDTSITIQVPPDTDGYFAPGYLHLYIDSSAVSAPLYSIQPVISSVDKTAVVAGTNLAITGKYLQDMFGSATAYYYTVKVFFNGVQGTVTDSTWTKTGLTAVVPSGATSGAVRLDFTMTSTGQTISAEGPTVEVWQPFTTDPYSALQQYLKVVGIDRAWSLSKVVKTQIVAVIDDGVYVNHPDLRSVIWKNPKEKIGNKKDDDKNGYVDDIYGWDFISNEGEMTTRGSHGTMVAGIIGAVRDNSVGIAGINPKVKIMPLIVCGAKGCPTAAVTKAIRYAVNNGATIINLSLSTTTTTGYTTDFNSAIKYAHDHGVIVVAAAGNGDTEGGIGQDLNVIPQSPVCNDIGKNAVVGVGAITNSGYLTQWSNFGNCVDAYAPGEDVISTAVPVSSSLGGFYDVESGTSFSAPIMTGLISLVKQQYPLMPYNDLLKRLYRNENTGIIDAVGFVGESYITPIKLREADANKGIKVDKKVVAKYAGVLLRPTKGAARLWYLRPTKGKRFEITSTGITSALMKLSVAVPESVIKAIPKPGQKGGSQAVIAKYKGQILRVKNGKKYWYISPKDGKKYEMYEKTAIKVLKKLSTPVSSADLGKVPIGLIE
ncbi:MAG: S8 family serine peptidase [Patescibacteria group bacterium]